MISLRTDPTEKQKKVLRGLSFCVEPGQKVALVGKAGCGKSTAITLVQRFYDVVSGSISLDGHPLASYDLHHLRAHTGVVAQENILFSATIRENICYGMGANGKMRDHCWHLGCILPRVPAIIVRTGLPEPTDEMVAAACEAANAHEFIAEFPQGLSTLVKFANS